jgi:AAA domain
LLKIAGGYIVCQSLYLWFENRRRISRLRSAFNQGAVPKPEVPLLIPRAVVSKEIQSIIKPPLLYGHYDIVVGKSGTGKTTLVRMEGHKNSGIIYVDIPPESSFEGAFAEALRWSPEIQKLGQFLAERLFDYKEPEKGNIPCQWYFYKLNIVVKKPFFDELMSHFREYAMDYKKTNGQPPVLVIDHVNYLADKNPELLNGLQDIAKDAADNNTFFTVFVTGEDYTPMRMSGKYDLCYLM